MKPVVCFHETKTDKVFKDRDGEHCVTEGDTIRDLRQLWRDPISVISASTRAAKITALTRSCHESGLEPMIEGHRWWSETVLNSFTQQHLTSKCVYLSLMGVEPSSRLYLCLWCLRNTSKMSSIIVNWLNSTTRSPCEENKRDINYADENKRTTWSNSLYVK